jgi:protein-S-isoprenylcysteine O-methyltransferase Ste14
MGLLIFVSAGTVRYWQAWVYLSIFFGASALTTSYLIRHDPVLLERRMSGGPTAEKRVSRRSSCCARRRVSLRLVVPALDHRYHWSTVPLSVAVAGDLLVALGLYFIFLVYRENTFTSATIEVAPDQTVISTGPYAVVRHPMYASGLLYVLGTPLALGSYWDLVPLAAMSPFLIWRLFDEERFRERLPGYTEYQQKVRHRLVPRIW